MEHKPGDESDGEQAGEEGTETNLLRIRRRQFAESRSFSLRTGAPFRPFSVRGRRIVGHGPEA